MQKIGTLRRNFQFILLIILPLHILYLSYDFFLDYLFLNQTSASLGFFIFSNLAIILAFAMFTTYYISTVKSNSIKLIYVKRISVAEITAILLAIYAIGLALPVALEIGFFNRLVRKELFHFFEGSIWNYGKIFIIVVFTKRLVRGHLSAGILILLVLVGFLDIMLTGGRRLFTTLLMVFIYSKIGTYKNKDVILFLFISVGLFIFGGLREFIVNPYILASSFLELAARSNEFQVVSQGIEFYSNLTQRYSYQFGATYFLFLDYIYNLAAGLPNLSVGRENGYFIGFFSELYFNFGNYGFLFYFLLITIYCIFLNANSVLLKSFLISFSLEFLRTSMAEFILLFILFLLMFITSEVLRYEIRFNSNKSKF
jgi:hypothetical protein